MILQPPLLEAEDLGRRHPDGTRWLLEDVSLAIQPGAALALAGDSGSGKTLLLRALALLDPLERGSIRWQGRPVRQDAVPAFRRQAIYLHQRPVMLGETVEATLAQPFSLAVYRGSRFDKDRALELLAQLFRDRSFLAKRSDDLSGGETQITALVRAVQLDPALLLLDEPTAAMDRQTASAAEELLRRWLDESGGTRAYVWVSHNHVQVDRVAETILHVKDGRLVREHSQ